LTKSGVIFNDKEFGHTFLLQFTLDSKNTIRKLVAFKNFHKKEGGLFKTIPLLPNLLDTKQIIQVLL
tara:strand:- start:8690 stop:8890 length:201 start_codon:yes stop_codon:yes gene_type:complete